MFAVDKNFRAVIPTLTGEALQLAVHLYDALDYWQQSQFGGAIAVHNSTQTDPEDEQAQPRLLPGQAEGGEEQEEGSDLQQGENPNKMAARKWQGLAGTTASQAEAALGSLDLTAVGEPTLPEPCGEGPSCNSQATTLPWQPVPAMAVTGELTATLPEEGEDFDDNEEDCSTDSEGSHQV
ncbi:unnamed protein product, partial [Symbiodinium sp. KB8]